MLIFFQFVCFTPEPEIKKDEKMPKAGKETLRDLPFNLYSVYHEQVWCYDQVVQG